MVRMTDRSVRAHSVVVYKQLHVHQTFPNYVHYMTTIAHTCMYHNIVALVSHMYMYTCIVFMC